MENKPKNTIELSDLIEENSKIEETLNNNTNLSLLKKSKFYLNGSNLREHIATYKGYAILLKQEQLSKFLDSKEKEDIIETSLVTLNTLKQMKKVNGNIIRKMQPKAIGQYDKMALLYKTIIEIDKI